MIIYQVAASSNLAQMKEENALLAGTSARPADVLIPHCSRVCAHSLLPTKILGILTLKINFF
jgi:hypothetical protein